MIERLFSAIILVAASLAIFGCGRKSAQERGDELAQADAYAAAVDTIRKQCQSGKPDWNAVTTALKPMQPVLLGCDTRYETTYQADLDTAAQLCASGENVAVNSQVLAATPEVIATKIIREQLDVMPLVGERNHANELIAAYFEAIRFRFKECDRIYFKDLPFIEREAGDSIRYLKSSQGSDLIMAVEDMQNIIMRAYALTVLHELETVEAGPEGPKARAALKRAEIFYGVLAERFQLLARKEHSLLTTMLAGDPSSVNVKEAEAAIQNGLGQGFLLK